MANKVARYLIQNGEFQDDVLHRTCFPVNIRLLKENWSYMHIIEGIISHMLEVMEEKFSDYPKCQGISGANVGIPFNIVIIKSRKGNIVMLNPEIIAHSSETVATESNCGSINLEEKIIVTRYKEVTVKYIDWPEEEDFEVIGSFNEQIKTFKSGTVQHEIDHNNGILIIDRAK
ncbi:MAG TPA: peptide deformylase [Patescibacteria group bacterium]|nr:peptide deformylase [Patescibacteria group bacterium]